MQKSGKITSIVPDGGYQSQNGFISTFQMGIQCPDGAIVGQIGAKSQAYPLTVGQDITVEMTTTQHGVRLKKINAQYAGQDGQGGGRPASGNKDRLIVAQVVFKAMSDAGGVNEQLLTENVDMIMRVGSGQAAPAGQTTSPQDTGDDIPF